MNYEEICDVFFPSLETLLFFNCQKLRLGDVSDTKDIDNNLLLPPFTGLSSLEILGCSNLTCMPTFPYLIEKLDLLDGGVKPLIETCLVELHSSSFYPLSALKFLHIGLIDLEAMPEKWMKNLISLEGLSLWDLSITPPLSQHLQHLPSELHSLGITYVHDDKLDLWEDEHDDITQCPATFNCLCFLQNILLLNYKNLKALPEQIGNL